MGQIIGTPGLHSSVGPFGRLPKKALESIWASYNLLGDIWGLSAEDLKMIVEGADYCMEINGGGGGCGGFEADFVKQIFILFDTDKNGIVDALELVMGLALISGMDSIEKVLFSF